MNSRRYINLDPFMQKDGISAHRLYDMTEGQIIHITLEPGAGLKPHITPVNVVFYILEGIADIGIDEEMKSFPPDTLIESPKDIPHAVYNNGDSNLRLLVMKLPKP